MTANPRLMNIHELAETLGVAEQTIRCNRATHPLYKKALKLGGHTSPLKWRREDVDNYLDELTQESA